MAEPADRGVLKKCWHKRVQRTSTGAGSRDLIVELCLDCGARRAWSTCPVCGQMAEEEVMEARARAHLEAKKVEKVRSAKAE